MYKKDKGTTRSKSRVTNHLPFLEIIINLFNVNNKMASLLKADTLGYVNNIIAL